MPRASSLSPLALAALELLLEKSMHPYEMQQLMRIRRADRVLKMKAGSLYHAIERLLERGLIEVAETTRVGRRPERTHYRITDAGRQAYAEQVQQMLETIAEEYPQFPLALSFGDDLGREPFVSGLQERAEELETRLDFENVTIDQLERMNLPRRFWLDVRYQKRMLETELAFVREILAEIESGEIDWDTESKLETPGAETAARLASANSETKQSRKETP